MFVSSFVPQNGTPVDLAAFPPIELFTIRRAIWLDSLDDRKIVALWLNEKGNAYYAAMAPTPGTTEVTMTHCVSVQRINALHPCL